MALTITGTTLTGTPRVSATLDGETVGLEGLGRTDLDSATCLQTEANGFVDLNNFIAAWADSENCTPRAAMLRIRLMLDNLLNNQNLGPTLSGVYEP